MNRSRSPVRTGLSRIAAAIIAALLGLFVAAVLWAGSYLTRPARASTGAPDPALRAQKLTIESAAGVKLSAWFVPGSSGTGAILLLHGIRANKRAMLPRAQFLNALGFSVLLVDLQAHGESEGDLISFGYREGADVSGSIRRLRELAPGERLGVLGTSMGAAALAFSDAHESLAAAVIEALYPGIEDAVANRLRLRFGSAGTWLEPLLLAQLSPRLGITPAQLRPIERVLSLRCPVLLVHGEQDRHTTIEEGGRIFAALPGPKEFYLLPGAAHVDLHGFGGKEYEQRVGDFFARHLRTEG